MKRFITTILFGFCFTASADFLDATEAYEAKDYTEAFKQFETLAKLGNKRAQFNLAVMYLNGEGVEQDLTKAYAWGKLSERDDKPEFSAVSQSILKQLPKDKHDQLAQAEEYLNQQYGIEALENKLNPLVLIDQPKLEDVEITINERTPPQYPRKALMSGIQGWATVLMDIYPDGTVRSASVIESFPDDIFNAASIDAVSKFKFTLKSKKPIEKIIQARQTIEFELQTKLDESDLKAKYKKRLDQLEQLAINEHPQAQYLYAVAGNVHLLHSNDRMTEEEVNNWLLKSAQNGFTDAQYLLGKNILYGNGCKANNEKGLKWLLYAAENGHDKASRELYQLQKHNNAQSDVPAHHWLALSAKGGNPESQLEYAMFLIETQKHDKGSIILASDYLYQYSKKREKSVQWYQATALLEMAKGNDKKAQKYQKKADKLAKKLGWDMTLAMQ